MVGKQLHVSTEESIEIEQFVSPRNSDESAFIKKPARGTGFWTSTWREKTQDSDWVEWCEANDFNRPYQQHWHILKPKDNIKLYKIDGLQDLKNLLRVYPWGNSKLKEYSLSRTFIDFERIAQDYDGIWLTEQGNYETHLSYPDDLNGWDCESILWCQWCFAEIQRIEIPQPVMAE